jgi:hypothetical protein
MNSIVRTILATIIAYTSHFSITQLYTTFCIPLGFYGYIQGILTMGSPICGSLLSIMTYTQSTYGTLVITGISSLLLDIITKIPHIKQESSPPTQ